MSWNTYVTATDCDRFSLSLNSTAFVAVKQIELTTAVMPPTSGVQTRVTSENFAVPEA